MENVYHEIYVEAEYEAIYEIYQRKKRNKTLKGVMNATLVAFFHYVTVISSKLVPFLKAGSTFSS